jgi:hypothetical protein
MGGETRLLLLSNMFHKYLPRNAFASIDQVPALLQVFILHLPVDERRRLLDCWPEFPLSDHVLSGVWIGVPGRAL